MKKLLVGQSGGPTAAINATLRGVIEGALSAGSVSEVLGMVNGVEGALQEKFVNLGEIFKDEYSRELLSQTPAAYLGSCRLKLPENLEDSVYANIFDIFKRHDIGFFLYIGGNDSMDTVCKLSKYAALHGSDVKFVGVPKTIDNDLAVTDHCPGYGSAAKYIAATVREIARDSAVYDLKSVTIIEIMGRNAGWLTAAASLARSERAAAPHLIYLPEVPFDSDRFIEDIKNVPCNNVVVAVSEGIKDKDGAYICECASGVTDAFGHKMLSGAGKVLEGIVRSRIGCKVRSIEINTPQRCASHMASATDLAESRSIGRAGAEAAIKGESGVMMYFCRTGEYKTEIHSQNIFEIANNEKRVPASYISPRGNDVTDSFKAYAAPLIMGEPELIYEDGLPVHIIL